MPITDVHVDAASSAASPSAAGPQTANVNSSSPLEDQVAGAEKRVRIPQPPYIRLREAVSIANKIYEEGAGTADATMLTKITGNSSSSSSFGRKLQALRVYRLTGGMMPPVTLTEIGTAIVAPRDEHQRLLNLKGAALGPEAFRTAYERYKGKLLPQDDFLLNAFQQDLSVSRVVAGLWMHSFKAALEFAELFYVRPDGKTQVLDLASTSPSPESSKSNQPIPQPVEERVAETIPVSAVKPSEALHDSGHTSRVSLSQGRSASIFVPDQLTKKEAARIKGALGGIIAIVDSMVIDDEDLSG